MRRRDFVAGLIATAGRPLDIRAEQAPSPAPVDYPWFAGSVNGQYRLRVTEEAARSLRIDLRSWV